eukprot:TRINITY_DN36728_c0_g1_i1.p1 TRINITY_DN36728_c0_g1~~TRINITY_DN36728_c0_g1_i1.p1  ORF type:complete len:663 (-),score=147.54 TRINITY_DN36728_c0_g1_i1:191-2179(-)
MAPPSAVSPSDSPSSDPWAMAIDRAASDAAAAVTSETSASDIPTCNSACTSDGGGDAGSSDCTCSSGSTRTSLLASAQQRGRRLAGRLSVRVFAAQGDLEEALRIFDVSRGGSSCSLHNPGVRFISKAAGMVQGPELSQRSRKVARGDTTKRPQRPPMATASSNEGPSAVAPVAAEIAQIAERCWDSWQRKHKSLTASEALYAALLADSRRAATFMAEIAAVQGMLKAEVDTGAIQSEAAEGDVVREKTVEPAPKIPTSVSLSAEDKQESPRLLATTCSDDGGAACVGKADAAPPVALAAGGTDSASASAEAWAETAAAEILDGLPSGGISKDRRKAALVNCCAELVRQNAEAISGFYERSKNYPCGSAAPATGYLRIARTPKEIALVREAFNARVEEERREAFTQALELVLAASLPALEDSLNRRLEFWEGEIEENWTAWTRESSTFHDACDEGADQWAVLQACVEDFLDWIWHESRIQPPQEAAPIVYLLPLLDIEVFQQRRYWEMIHDGLVGVVVAVAKMGAWADFHNLRGDGLMLQQKKNLMLSALEVLDTCFDKRFGGSAQAANRLANSKSWCRVTATSAAGHTAGNATGTCDEENLASSGDTGGADGDGKDGGDGKSCWWAISNWPKFERPPDPASLMRVRARKYVFKNVSSSAAP